MSFLQRFFTKKLFWQYVMVFVLVGIIPFIAITGITLNRMSQALTEEATERVTQMIHSSAVNLDAQFDSLASLTKQMYLYRISENGKHSNLEEIIKDNSNAASYLKNYIAALEDSNKYIRNVIFIDEVNQQVYGIGRPAVKTIRADWNYQAWELLKKAAQSPRNLMISSPHVDSYFRYGKQTVLTFCRPLLSLDELPEKETILGYLLLDIDQSIFGDFFQADDWQGTGSLYILDENNFVIYAGSTELIGTVFSDEKAHDDSMLREDISTCNWRILFDLDEQQVLSPVKLLRSRLLVLAALVLAVMLVITWLSSRKMSMPIHRILKQMEQVRSGNLQVSVPVKGHDELSELSRGFNHMTASLQKYIEQSYVASIRQKEAELDALRMQIHPHFLYNTLEVIRMSSVAHQDTETAQMTMSLVNQMQYVIGESNEQVTLQKELSIVRDYISLVSLRYGQIEMKVNIHASLLLCSILKMTLQPVVENAVQHGLRPLGGGQISINAIRRENDLFITVMDSGVGMDEAQLTKLREQLNSEKMPEVKEDGLRSIGMKNVYDRIRLACGAEYGLEIESHPGIGTAVVIHLPYRVLEMREEH